MNELYEKKTKEEKIGEIKKALEKLNVNLSKIVSESWNKMKAVTKKHDEEKIKNLLKDIEQI